MAFISEKSFAAMCADIGRDRAIIVRHNPIGDEREVLLWMLLGCLVTFLSLSEMETPCFTGKPDADTYLAAILHVLNGRTSDAFDPRRYIEAMLRS